MSAYRGRLAPSPTGFLHRGHARTFWIAQQRADAARGALILRNDDLDRARCRAEYVDAMFEDMRWLGLRWSEGADVGGPHAPYTQSVRMPLYRAAFEGLRDSGFLFPCTCSRQDVLRALGAPHAGEDEPLYPGTCRGKSEIPARSASRSDAGGQNSKSKTNWRFRVPMGEAIEFTDGALGPQRAVAGADFGDFLVWRKDDLPSYQLACTVDDALMQITEVVRGADLIASTARQLLLYRALGWPAPAFYHCPLVHDENGKRLAKRDATTTVRGLRAAGLTPATVRS